MEMRREFNHVWLFAGKKAKSLICSVSSDLLNGVRITGSMRGRWISYCSLSLLNGWNRFNAARGQATAGPPHPCTWQGAPEKLVASSRFRGGGGGGRQPAPSTPPHPWAWPHPPPRDWCAEQVQGWSSRSKERSKRIPHPRPSVIDFCLQNKSTDTVSVVPLNTEERTERQTFSSIWFMGE